MKWWNPTTWFSSTPQAYPRRLGQLELDLYHAGRRLERARENLLSRERVLSEAAWDVGAPYEVFNPWAAFYDGMKLMFPLFPSRFDNRLAQNYLFLSQGQLDLLRSFSRWLYEVNPYAQAALNSLADYVIATGFKYNVSSRRHATAPKSLLRLCNKFLEDALNRARWWEWERELYVRRKRDGDAFIEFFPQDSGVTEIRVVEPEQVRTQDNQPDHAFGVITPEDDAETHLGYEVWRAVDEQEVVPASMMVMLKNHTDRRVRRGLSDFFVVHELLDESKKLLQTGRQGEAVRQSIAYIREWELAAQADVDAALSGEADGTLPRYSSSTGQGTENYRKVTGVDVVDMPPQVQFKEGPKGDAGAGQAWLESTLKAAAVKWRFPAWMLTGDVSVNFAAALVAESPLTKRGEYDQFLHIQDYTGVCRRLLEIGVAQGVLPQDTLEKVEVTAEGSPIAARNQLQETQINEILNRNRLLSRRTWAARENLDYDQQQDEIREEGPVAGTESAPTQSPTPGAEYQREVRR